MTGPDDGTTLAVDALMSVLGRWDPLLRHRDTLRVPFAVAVQAIMDLGSEDGPVVWDAAEATLRAMIERDPD